MRQKPFLKTKRGLVVVVGLVLLALFGVWYFFYYPQDPTRSYKPQYPQASSSDERPASTTQQPTKESGTPLDTRVSEDVPVASQGLIDIADLNQKDGFVNARAQVSGFSVVKCVYQFESTGARPVIREQSGGCSGVSIPQVEFEKIGTYTLTVTTYGDTDKLSASKDILVR